MLHITYDDQVLLDIEEDTTVVTVNDTVIAVLVQYVDGRNRPCQWFFYHLEGAQWVPATWGELSNYHKAQVRVSPMRGVRVRDLKVCPGGYPSGSPWYEKEEGLIALEALETSL